MALRRPRFGDVELHVEFPVTVPSFLSASVVAGTLNLSHVNDLTFEVTVVRGSRRALLLYLDLLRSELFCGWNSPPALPVLRSRRQD